MGSDPWPARPAINGGFFGKGSDPVAPTPRVVLFSSGGLGACLFQSSSRHRIRSCASGAGRERRAWNDQAWGQTPGPRGLRSTAAFSARGLTPLRPSSPAEKRAGPSRRASACADPRFSRRTHRRACADRCSDCAPAPAKCRAWGQTPGPRGLRSTAAFSARGLTPLRPSSPAEKRAGPSRRASACADPRFSRRTHRRACADRCSDCAPAPAKCRAWGQTPCPRGLQSTAAFSARGLTPLRPENRPPGAKPVAHTSAGPARSRS